MTRFGLGITFGLMVGGVDPVAPVALSASLGGDGATPSHTLAGGRAGVVWEFNLDLASASQQVTTLEPVHGPSERQTAIRMITHPDGGELILGWEQVRLYTYPHQAGTALKLGWTLGFASEVGFGYGRYLSDTDKPANLTDTVVRQLFYRHSFGLPASQIEAVVAATYHTQVLEVGFTDGDSSRSDSVGTGLSAAGAWVIPLQEAVFYRTGLKVRTLTSRSDGAAEDRRVVVWEWVLGGLRLRV